MINFSYTEKNKEELFENGCTFFRFTSDIAKNDLKFWQSGILKILRDSSSQEYKELQCLISIHQHWHHINFSRVSEILEEKDFKDNINLSKKTFAYQKRMYEYIKEINDFFYKENGTLDNHESEPVFQIYNLNDCILPHSDGIRPGRNASLLMYLGVFGGDKHVGWYPELGGELVVSKPTSTGYNDWKDPNDPYIPTQQFVCPPASGTCALIDFTKGYPRHEVKNMNVRGFQRIVLNTFLTTTHNE